MLKLKIVRVITAPYNVQWHLANTLKRMPADFTVYVVGQDVSKYQEVYPDVTFKDININRKLSIGQDCLALFSLCKFLLKEKPNIVHSILPKAGLLTSLAGFICKTPVRIHTFTGQTWATKTGFARLFYKQIDKLIVILNSCCLTDSISQSTYLLENGIPNSGEPLRVLSNGSLSGVELTRFNKDALADYAANLKILLKLTDKHFVYSYIARKTRDKGAIDILEAFSVVSSKCENVKLLFVGPDEDGEIAKLHTTRPELFNNVIDIGPVSNHEVYLAITDVLCLPSYREGFGSIVIEAAAMGVPAIGSNIPGLTDAILDNQSGLLFSAGNINDLVQKMLFMIGNINDRDAMGTFARDRVISCFSADRLYSELRVVYYELTRNHGKNSRF